MQILYENLLQITWQQVVMWAVGGLLIYLAIKRDMEPTLLLPMGFGTNLEIALIHHRLIGNTVM